jgi:hypothetical protein
MKPGIGMVSTPLALDKTTSVGVRFSAALCFALLGYVPQASATSPEVLGAHEGWLDRMGAGIRELGRGNTGTLIEESSAASYWNPALIGLPKRTQIAAGADARTADRIGGFASVQGRASGQLGLGLSVVHRGDFDIVAYDADEREIGTAKPQAIASYLGLGLRTSRSQGFGVSVGWYSQYLDVGDGIGDVNVIGFFNLGWYRRMGEHIRVGAVVRNLGLDPELNAGFDQITLGEETVGGFERTSQDFWPKTLVVAGAWLDTLMGRPYEIAVEVMDYQLKPSLYALDANFHAQRLRWGGEWEAWPDLRVRTGMDGMNISAGFGYDLRWRKRPLRFDYALTIERNVWSVNPMAVSIRYDI